MAYSLVANTTPARGAFSGVTTGAIDTTGANLLIIAMACDTAYSTTPTDSKGNTWTQLTSYTTAVVRVRIYYCIPTSVGTSHTFSASGSIAGYIMGAAFSGAASSSPADQQSGANSIASTLQPGSITPSEDNELIFSVLGFGAAGTPVSINSSFIELGEGDFVSGESYGCGFAYLIQTTAAAVNPTWTRTNSDHLVVTQASFKASAATANGAGFLALL